LLRSATNSATSQTIRRWRWRRPVLWLISVIRRLDNLRPPVINRFVAEEPPPNSPPRSCPRFAVDLARIPLARSMIPGICRLDELHAPVIARKHARVEDGRAVALGVVDQWRDAADTRSAGPQTSFLGFFRDCRGREMAAGVQAAGISDDGENERGYLNMEAR
jgi:hypothetical protein